MMGRELTLLQAAHAHPGLTRAAAARMLNLSTGAATDLVARLGSAALLSERPAAPTGSRGRPTSELAPHPDGPLVLACAISHEHWRLDVVQLGGESIATTGSAHTGARPEPALAAIGEAVGEMRRRFGERIRGFGVSAPGTIRDGYLLDAVSLGWQAVDLRRIWPDAEVAVIGNDANLAAVAESRRGASRGSALALHVHTDFGLGGAVITEGRVLAGVHETAGEFGHMPFGDPALVCPCGARGCWGLTVDGGEMARLLGAPPPSEPVTFALEVIARAAQGSRRDAEAVDRVAANLGRGVAGLVNAFDPDIVTLSGLAAPVLDTSPEPLLGAYDAGLMSVRRESAPPIVPSALGEAGPLVGASEQVWDGLWLIL